MDRLDRLDDGDVDDDIGLYIDPAVEEAEELAGLLDELGWDTEAIEGQEGAQ